MSSNYRREINQEIHMYTKTALIRAWLVFGAPLVACTLFAGVGAAEDQEFTVAFQVSTQGLDARQPAGARELYVRLKHAASIVCTHGMRVDLKPLTDEDACYEKALGDAIRSFHRPLLTQAYLETHTLRQAAASGIDVPVMIASK
jgi:UrcA family protein